MASSQISAQTRVQVLIEYVNEKELDCGEVAELKRVRLQQIIQLLQLQNEASQVSLKNLKTSFLCLFTLPFEFKKGSNKGNMMKLIFENKKRIQNFPSELCLK